MEEEKLRSVHRLYEVSRPKTLQGEELNKSLSDLFDACVPDFEKWMKRPDGSRIFQMMFRRGNPELKSKILNLFAPKGNNQIIFLLATTRYSYHLFATFVRYSTNENLENLIKILKGTYEKLLVHAIGMRSLNILFVQACKKRMQKLILDEFYNEKEGNQQKLVDLLSKACDKGAGRYEITHVLMEIIREPKALSRFVIYLKELAFSQSGSAIALKCIKNSQQKSIEIALKLMDKIRKEVIPGASQDVGTDGGDEIEEEEDLDEEVNQEDVSQVVAETMCGKMATDQWAWRVLSYAISSLETLDVIHDEVLPNLMDDWKALKGSRNGLRVLLRMLAAYPSVWNGIKFQNDVVQPHLREMTAETLLPLVKSEMAEMPTREHLCSCPEGSRIVVELLKNTQTNEEEFSQLSQYVFATENVTHNILHKLIRTAAASDLANGKQLARKAVDSVGLTDVLASPGAWIVAELVKTDKALLKTAKQIISKNKIEGPAIISIVNPRKVDKVQSKRSKSSKTKKT